MEAHSLSPQYLLVADDSHSSQIPRVWLEGDFAAGLRGSGPAGDPVLQPASNERWGSHVRVPDRVRYGVAQPDGVLAGVRLPNRP
jgi:hypothetical protein